MRAIQTLARRLGFPAEPGRTADCHVVNLTSASLRLPIYTMAKDRRGRYHLLTPDGRDLVTTDRFRSADRVFSARIRGSSTPEIVRPSAGGERVGAWRRP